MNTLSIIKSKIIWVQIVSILALLFAQYGELGFMNASIAMFISFSLTAILQKFASYKSIVNTGISRDNTLFWINVVGALTMIVDYFLDNKVFDHMGANSSTIGMIVVTINIVLRIYFTNQSLEEGKGSVQETQ